MSFCIPRDQPEKEREGEGERERERVDMGGSQISKKPVREAGLKNWSILYCLGKDYLIRNIKRLGKSSVVGKLVEKRG